MTLSYEETRGSEHLRLLPPAIDAFISRARYPTATTSTCPRQTVFFFPGGLASQLLRATKKFQCRDHQAPDLRLRSGLAERGGSQARSRATPQDGAGVFRDKGDRIIVASGPAGGPRKPADSKPAAKRRRRRAG